MIRKEEIHVVLVLKKFSFFSNTHLWCSYEFN